MKMKKLWSAEFLAFYVAVGVVLFCASMHVLEGLLVLVLPMVGVYFWEEGKKAGRKELLVEYYMRDSGQFIRPDPWWEDGIWRRQQPEPMDDDD